MSTSEHDFPVWQAEPFHAQDLLQGMNSPCLEYKYVIVGESSSSDYADSWEEIEGNRTVMLTQPPADGSSTVLLEDTYGVKDARSQRERTARAMQGHGQHTEPAAFYRGGHGFGPYADDASASYSSLHSAVVHSSPYAISPQHSMPVPQHSAGYMGPPAMPEYAPQAEQRDRQSQLGGQ